MMANIMDDMHKNFFSSCLSMRNTREIMPATRPPLTLSTVPRPPPDSAATTPRNDNDPSSWGSPNLFVSRPSPSAGSASSRVEVTRVCKRRSNNTSPPAPMLRSLFEGPVAPPLNSWSSLRLPLARCSWRLNFPAPKERRPLRA